MVPVRVPDIIILADCNGLPSENTLPAILADCANVMPVDIQMKQEKKNMGRKNFILIIVT